MSDFGPTCPVCLCDMEMETCWVCDGAGGWHECGEDTCVCRDKERITDVCAECRGVGEVMACPNADRHKLVSRSA